MELNGAPLPQSCRCWASLKQQKVTTISAVVLVSNAHGNRFLCFALTISSCCTTFQHCKDTESTCKQRKDEPLGGLGRCHHKYPPDKEQPWPHTATCSDPATPLPDTSASNNPGYSQPAGASQSESLQCSISKSASVHFHIPGYACQLILICKAEKVSSCPRGP